MEGAQQRKATGYKCQKRQFRCRRTHIRRNFGIPLSLSFSLRLSVSLCIAMCHLLLGKTVSLSLTERWSISSSSRRDTEKCLCARCLLALSGQFLFVATRDVWGVFKPRPGGGPLLPTLLIILKSKSEKRKQRSLSRTKMRPLGEKQIQDQGEENFLESLSLRESAPDNKLNYDKIAPLLVSFSSVDEDDAICMQIPARASPLISPRNWHSAASIVVVVVSLSACDRLLLLRSSGNHQINTS